MKKSFIIFSAIYVLLFGLFVLNEEVKSSKIDKSTHIKIKIDLSNNTYTV